MYYRSRARGLCARQPPLGEGLWRQGRSAAEREGEGSECFTSSNLMRSPLSPQSYQLQL